MKKHLINLLFEQYKLTSFVGKLSDLGVEMDNLQINNYEIALDIIGFPKDNQKHHFKLLEMKRALTSFDPKNPPDGFFSREDLYERFLITLVNLGADDSIVLTHDGLIMEKQEDENTVKQALAEHVDWLYGQYENAVNKSLV